MGNVKKNASKVDHLPAFKGGFFDAKINKEDTNMSKALALKDRISTGYWSLVAMGISMLLSLQPVLAAVDNTIWTKISQVMKDVYGQLLGISTIVAVTAAAIALLVRMISRNQRAVDEATTWLKRILITWLILNTLGFIIAYLQGYIDGGRYSV